MFSKACEYAIRAMMFVAQKSKEGMRVSFKEIAKGIGGTHITLSFIFFFNLNGCDIILIGRLMQALNWEMKK
jgi:hypothetical protein